MKRKGGFGLKAKIVDVVDDGEDRQSGNGFFPAPKKLDIGREIIIFTNY